MYVSNQTRQRRYRKERQAEEANGDETQLQLFNYLSEQSQNDAQATQLAEMAARVGAKVSSNEEPEVNNVEGNDMRKSKSGNGFAKLLAAISSGKFDVFFSSMMQVDPKKLPPMVAATQEIMKSATFKKEVNQKLESLVEQNKAQPKTIANALVAALNENALFQQRVRSRSGESVNSNFSEVSEENKPSAEEAIKQLAQYAPSQAPTMTSSVDDLLRDIPVLKNVALFETTAFKNDVAALTKAIEPDQVENIKLHRQGKSGELKNLVNWGELFLTIASDGIHFTKKAHRSTSALNQPIPPEQLEKLTDDIKELNTTNIYAQLASLKNKYGIKSQTEISSI